MCSIVQVPCANRAWRAWFTSFKGQVRLYNNTVNLSISARSSIDMVCGLLKSLTNAGKAFHVSYAVFFPTPKKAETVGMHGRMEGHYIVLLY